MRKFSGASFRQQVFRLLMYEIFIFDLFTLGFEYKQRKIALLAWTFYLKRCSCRLQISNKVDTPHIL